MKKARQVLRRLVLVLVAVFALAPVLAPMEVWGEEGQCTVTVDVGGWVNEVYKLVVYIGTSEESTDITGWITGNYVINISKQESDENDYEVKLKEGGRIVMHKGASGNFHVNFEGYGKPPTPRPTVNPKPTVTVTPTPTATPTLTVTPTVTPKPTVTVMATATPMPKPTVIAKPIAPAGITATTSAAKAATISWKPVAGATGYEILRSNKKSSGFKSIKSLGASATSFKDTSVVEGKTYYYKVRSKNSSGFTDSGVMTVKTLAKTTSLKAGKSGNNLKVSYKSAEKNFQIQVSRKKGSGYKNVATNNKKKSLTVKNSSIKKALKLKKGKSYNLYVRTRSFRVVNNKKVYGSWTTTKVIKNFKIK